MTILNGYATATNVTGIKSVAYNEAHGQASAQAEITATGTTLNIGDACTVDIGYDTNHAAVITGGIVKSVNVRKPEMDRVIVVNDVLIKAVDYFMASDDPDSPFTASNISGEDLVVNLLAQAGITGVTTDPTSILFAVEKPTPINLISAWDAVENIARISGFTCYATAAGAVKFSSRKPYIVGGDASAHTFTTGNSGDILSISYLKSDENIRNRVVVYGATGIKATASASSPYLPANFYKTMTLGHELISASGAQAIADLNLTMFNRLTERVTLTVVGDPSYKARGIVDVAESFVGLSAGALWYVFSARHMLGAEGYTCNLNLVR